MDKRSSTSSTIQATIIFILQVYFAVMLEKIEDPTTKIAIGIVIIILGVILFHVIFPFIFRQVLGFKWIRKIFLKNDFIEGFWYGIVSEKGWNVKYGTTLQIYWDKNTYSYDIEGENWNADGSSELRAAHWSSKITQYIEINHQKKLLTHFVWEYPDQATGHNKEDSGIGVITFHSESGKSGNIADHTSYFVCKDLERKYQAHAWRVENPSEKSLHQISPTQKISLVHDAVGKWIELHPEAKIIHNIQPEPEAEPFMIDSFPFDPHGYSDSDALSIFLPTLSYAQVGVPVFSKWINEIKLPDNAKIMDIGAGDGYFTDLLITALRNYSKIPSQILAIDPDENNLKKYQSILSQNHPDIKLHLQKHSIETMDARHQKYWVVMLSHSLYALLESPRYSRKYHKMKINNILDMVSDDGLMLISMAGMYSKAYKFKAELLNGLSLSNRSIFGEHVINILNEENILFSYENHNSYMDVSDILNDKEKLLLWCRYFSRISLVELRNFGYDNIRNILLESSIEFNSLDVNTQNDLKTKQAPVANLQTESRILLHEEIFIKINPQRKH